MALLFSYESQFVGAKAVALSDDATILRGLSNYGIVYSVNKGDYCYCTGYYIDKGNYWYVQTTDGDYLYCDFGNLQWSLTEATLAQKKQYVKTKVDAQKLVNKIIDCNAQIIQNNLLCARFANRLTKEQKKTLYDLQTRLNARNQSLLNDGLVAQVETSQPKGYAELQASLQSFMNNQEGVGIVITGTAVIVISAIVITALATAAYYAYKAMAAEAEQDVQFSDKLTKTLVSKLSASEYQQLLQETKGIVTKNSILQRIKNNYQWLAVAALVGFAGWGTYKILQQAK